MKKLPILFLSLASLIFATSTGFSLEIVFGDGIPSTTGDMPAGGTIDRTSSIATWYANGVAPGGQGSGFAGTGNNIISGDGLYLGTGFVGDSSASVGQFADPGALASESNLFLTFDWEVGAENGSLALDNPADNTFSFELLALDQDGAPGDFATGWSSTAGGAINSSSYTKVFTLNTLTGVTADAYGNGTATVSFDPQEFGADFEYIGIRMTAENVIHTDTAGLSSNQGSEFIRLSNFTLTNVPEPSAGFMLGLTGLGLLLARRRRSS